MSPKTPLLDQIHNPKDMKALSVNQLEQLSGEVRDDMLHAVSQTGGHLGAGLGVVELTVALHAVFDTPKDKLIWDVGHQAYPHKILTERRDRMATIRQGGGLAGFTKRKESEYDPFGAGHSSTSISAALGMAVARDFSNEDNHVVAVIGDGAMSAGQAYEALNNAGDIGSRLLVVLNDNDMSIAPPVGAMSGYLSRLLSSKSYRSIRDIAKKAIPDPLAATVKRAEEYARGMVAGGGTLFEELGFYYIGPVDGHNLHHLVPILKNIRDAEQDHPVLLHVVTEKGHGYQPAEQSADKYHGVAKFDVETGAQNKPKPNAPAYTKVFAEQLIEVANKDEKIVAITAAMPSGTGLNLFADKHSERCFDVGIAEQHAVTFAAGLACEGYKPFCAIYSTFLQRAYDQIVHDVAIQNLPVRFAIDRAGFVGADGQTHAGSFDVAYLGCVPNMMLMAPRDEIALQQMVNLAADYDAGPCAFRFPRGESIGLDAPQTLKPLLVGKGEILQEGNDVALLCYGPHAHIALEAAAELTLESGTHVTVADARFAKPLDGELIAQLLQNHRVMITIEEGSMGGFGSFVLHHIHQHDLLKPHHVIKTMHMVDAYIDQDSQANQQAQSGLDKASIKAQVKALAAAKKVA